MQLSGQAPRTEKKVPTRTCVGCRAEDRPAELVRVVRGPEGELAVDLSGGAFGRGAWLHPQPRCVQGAAPRGLSASFKAAVRVTPVELAALLREAATRRMAGLLAGARGARRLACGSTVVKEALEDGSANLVLVATDGRAAADAPWVQRAVAEGRAVAWGTKALLGELTGRSDTAVVAVLDRRLATTLSQTVAMIHMPEPAAASTGRRADDSREEG